MDTDVQTYATWSCPDLVEGHRFGFPRRRLEGDGRDVAQCGMPPDGIAEPVDVSPKGDFGLPPGLEQGAPDEVGLDGLEHGLDHGIVEARAPRKTVRFAVVRQQDTVLARWRAPNGVVQQRRGLVFRVAQAV